MASLNHLSNGELRKKLKEYGITSPVTNSTRNILLKKLNHIISSEKSEQLDLDLIPKSPPSGSKTVASNKLSRREIPETEKPVRVSPRSRSYNSRDFENDANSGSPIRSLGPSNLNSFSSDEDDGNQPVEVQPRKSSRRSIKDISSGRSSETRSPSYEKKTSVPIIRKRMGYSALSSYGDGKYPSRQSTRREEFQYDTGSDSDLCDETDAGYQQNSLNFGERLSSKKESIFGNGISYKRMNENSNFSPVTRSSFLPKLEQNGLDSKSSTEIFSNRSLGEQITSPDDIVTQEQPTANVFLPNGLSPLERIRKLASDQCPSDRDVWIPSIPIVLVVLLAAFFCLLGLCYVSIHASFHPSSILSYLSFSNYKSQNLGIEHEQEQPITDTTNAFSSSQFDKDLQNKFPLCGEEELSTCLTKEELNNVPDILGLLENTIFPALIHQVSLYQCDKSAHNYITVEEMSKLIHGKLVMKSKSEIRLGLEGLQKLSAINPHWGIKTVAAEESSYHEGAPEVIGFSTSSQPTEIFCHITSALYNFVYSLIALIVGCVGVWIVFQGFKFYRRQKEDVEQKSFELVERILEVLENSCGTGGKEFIAVNHVRDCLLRPRERKAKGDVWDRAVRFIDEHDSRVYREVRSVGGEDCEVWRWVSGAPRSPISCVKVSLPPDKNQPPEKIWQGQAFESLETTQNLPQVSPTSCLKIRNMFDCEIEFGENWPCRIQDSLLEKCEGIAITHIVVDRVSKEGCVYVKCSSATEAGKAFRALHGWWFDGHLVTVKYLREERYYERFPTARIATTPLTPSNNKRLSLQLYPGGSSSSSSKGAPATRRSDNKSFFGAS